MNEVDAYIERGWSYFRNNEYHQSFQDFLKAIELDPDIKFHVVPAYIAFYLNTTSEPPISFKVKTFEHCCKIWRTITKLKKHLLKPDATVTHYTSLDVLKNLLSGERFRFYNASHMNDPEEGETFFKILMEGSTESSIDIQDTFYDSPKNLHSPAYIGSFTKANTLQGQVDKLFLWRTYGKHKNQEASGACMVFNGYTCFSPKVSSGLETMKTQRNLSEEDTPDSLCLYKVVYRKDIEKYKDICTLMEELKTKLEAINEKCLNEATDKEKDLIHLTRRIVREILDEIRFLFKSDDYSEEKEMRVVSMPHIPVDGELSNSEIKEDTGHYPPRLYLDAPKELRFDKVVLGPQALGLAEWERWAQLKSYGRSVQIENSIISYKS